MTQVSRSTLKGNTNSLYADNNTGNISAADLRYQMHDLADSVPFRKTGRITAPLVTDDKNNTAGNGIFGIGDFWIDESNNRAYVCLDDAIGNAIWIDITASAGTSVTVTGNPTSDQIGVWSSASSLRGYTGLSYNATTGFLVPGAITSTGLVNGRDMAADGAKLDSLGTGTLDAITVTAVDPSGTASSFDATTLRFETGAGLAVSELSSGVAQIVYDNNNITFDITDRTISLTDNASFITNRGATGTVRWTLPTTSSLGGTPRMVATFFKTAGHTMEIIGANGVTINNITESGSEQSLVTICDNIYNTFAYVVYGGIANTYFVIQGSDVNKIGSPVTNSVAYWAGSKLVTGDETLTWDSGVLTVMGEVKFAHLIYTPATYPYTLVSTDQNRLFKMDDSAATEIIIPENDTVELPIGTEIRIVKSGTGTVTITAETGVTLNDVSAGSGDITTQWTELKLYKMGLNEWYAIGDIGTIS